MGGYEISINDARLGWVNVYRTPSVKAGESTTGKFIIPVYSIIDHTGFNLGDIEKMNFQVTSVVNLEDNDGEPVEITFKSLYGNFNVSRKISFITFVIKRI